MALTDYADIYAAIHDAGINRVIKQMMRQRPSLFNYGTMNIQKNLSLLCRPLDVQSNVTQFITVLDSLPIIGVQNLGLDYCIQLTDFKFEFFPSNTITLPPELKPLKKQHFAIQLKVCAGISCIPKEILKLIPFDKWKLLRQGTLRTIRHRKNPDLLTPLAVNNPENTLSKVNYTSSLAASVANSRMLSPELFKIPDKLIIPGEKLECFCLEVYVTGSTRIIGEGPNQSLGLDIDKIEIVDLEPKGMENNIECYALLALQRGILPDVIASVSELLFSPVSLGDLGELIFSASTSAPQNPAIENNQLKVHVNLHEINITLPEFGGEEEASPGSWPEPDIRYIPHRSRTDAYDLTTAVSESTLQRLFQLVGNQFIWELTDSGSWGPFSASYGVGVSVHDCDLELRSDHKMTVEFNIDIDTLYINFGIDIPEITIGGFCLIPNPFGGCLVSVPSTSFFSANPDITLPLDISNILRIALTFTAAPVVYYGEGTPNRWQLFIDPDPSLTNINIDGISDIPGTLLENAIDAAIDALGLPDWAEDVIEFILGPLVDVVKGLLGIAGDVTVWVINFLGTTLGLWDLIKGAILEYIGSTVPMFQLEDPLPLMPAETPEIEVTLPISYLEAKVNDTELILRVDVGGEL